MTFPHRYACAFSIVALLAGSPMASAQSGAPGPTFDGRDASYELSAGSTLRRGEKLTDVLLATVWQRTIVKGAGRCSAGACPVTYNGEEMYARRSRLRITGGDSGTSRDSAGSASRFPDAGSTSASSRFPDSGRSGSRFPDTGGTSAGGTSGAPNSGYPEGLRRLERGIKGDDVRRLQEALVRDGARLTPDGSYGRSTVTAIQEYQRRRGLKVDGVAGRETLRALGLMS